MRRSKRLAWMLAAAASLTAGGLVQAQYQITNNGRMRESSNLIGSGGYNNINTQPRITQGNFNNAIITGDITGGRQFRGDVGYTNPRAFRGQTAGGGVDNFVRQSSAAPIGGVLQNNAQAVQPYFGPSNAVAPPSGFAEQAMNTGAYVPAKPATRSPGDLRIGQTVNTPSTVLPLPGQLVMPGPVDPNTQSSTVITASPLYGVRQLNPSSNLADSAYLQHSMGGGAGDVRVDAALAEKLRQELIQSNQAIDSGPVDQQGTEPGQPTRGGRTAPADPNAPLQQGFDAPQNESLNQSSTLQSNQAVEGQINSSLATGARTQHRVMGAPKIRSSQYTELEKRLQQYRAVQELNELATAREYNQQLRARDEAAAAGGGTAAGGVPRTGALNAPDRVRTGALPGPIGPGPGPGGAPGGGAAPGGTTPLPPITGPSTTPPNDQLAIGPAPNPGQAPVVAPRVEGAPATPPPPVKIDSLAQGVQGQALADLLKEAEDLMKRESYGAALEKYDVADLVAPNSPLVQLGRANVELGRTYYARAEASLRQAFMQDQALLMGQYNLQNLLGRERLEIIVRDLRAIAEREATEARPVFLLAYIDYNTGNERRAAAYLDLAEKRAGANDPLYPLIRKYWSLPKDTAPTELNK